MTVTAEKTKALKSVKWVSFGNVLPKLFSPITTVLMANLFIPSEYGTIGISNAFIGFLTLIQGLGFSDYVIREKNLTDEKLNTAFWSNVLFSGVLYLILLLLSPVIAHIYKNPELAKILPVISLNLIFNAFGFTALTLLRKNLEFKKLFIQQFAPMLITLCITVPLGYLKFGVWALVFGSLILTFLTNLYFVIQSKWRPKLIFNNEQLFSMLTFGRFVLFEKFQEYLYANIDVFLIGFFLDLKTLGLYTLARSWSWIIFGMVTNPMTEILYPAFQQFSDDAEKMGKQFLEVLRRMLFVTLPIMILICGFGAKAIMVFFPDRWAEAGMVLAFLIVGDGITKNFSLQRDLFKLLGRPDIYPKAFLVNFFYTLVCYPIAAKFGLIPFLVVRVGNDILYTVIQYFLTKNTFGLSGAQFSSVVGAPLLSGFLTVLVVAGVNSLFYFEIVHLSVITLGSSLLFSGLTFMLMYYMLDKVSLLKFRDEGKVVLGFK